MIAFLAFFSVFPLLLIFITLLGYFLPPRPQADMLHSVAGLIPLLNTNSIRHLSGQQWTLVVWAQRAVERVVRGHRDPIGVQFGLGACARSAACQGGCYPAPAGVRSGCLHPGRMPTRVCRCAPLASLA